MVNGYTVTKATREALAVFRQTLPPAGSELRICPPHCSEAHERKSGTKAGSHAGAAQSLPTEITA